MKTTSFVVLIVILNGILFAQPQGKVPLTEAIEKGVSQDFEYLNTLLDQQRAGLEQELAAGNKLFRLDFEAGYFHRSSTMLIEFPETQIPGLGTIPGREIEAGLHNNFDFRFSLVQPLYSGGVLTNSVKLEEVRKAVEINREALKRNEISGWIKSSYIRYLLLKRQWEALLTLEESLALHRKFIDDLFQEGLVRKTDLLETLSEIEKVRLKINDADQALEKENIHFQKLCGYDPEDIDESYRELPITEPAARSYFEAYHPVLTTLQNQIEALSLQKKILTGKYLPQVNGYAEVHYAKPGIDFFRKEWMLYFQGGVLLRLPVFDWNRRSREKTVLSYEEQKLENQKKQFVRDVTRSLQQLYTSLRMFENQQSHVYQLILYSEEDAELKAALYREGQVPNVDYLTALLNKEKNQLLRDEVRIRIELLKVNINTLISRNKEDGDD